MKIFHDGEALASTLEAAGLRNGAKIQVVVLRSQRLLAGAQSGLCGIWDEDLAKKEKEFHHGAMLHVAASLHGLVGTGGADGDVVIRREEEVTEVARLRGHLGQVYDLAFDKTSSSLLSASGDSTGRFWDLATKEALFTLKGHTRDVNAVAIAPDGQVLATGSDDYCFALWDRRSASMLRNWDGRRGEGHSGRVYSVAFSLDGRCLATGAVDKRAKLWDLRQQRCLACESHEDLVNCVTFSPSGLVLSACDRGSVVVWTAEGETLATYCHPDAVLSASFADDGQLATGCRDGTIRLWSGEAELLNANVETKGCDIKSVCFIPT